jgi:hypothetical protein
VLGFLKSSSPLLKRETRHLLKNIYSVAPKMRTHEERIGVSVPGQGPHIVTVQVGALETDEVVLRRISTVVGTIFNVGGVKYEVTSSTPFRLKRVKFREEELPPETSQASTPEPEPTTPEPEPTTSKPETVRPPESTAVRLPVLPAPQVGERWRPKDPRRKADFVITAIEDDHVVTNDGRRIQLARFRRYELVPSSESKAS